MPASIAPLQPALSLPLEMYLSNIPGSASATGEPPEAVCTPPEVLDATDPDPALAELFAKQRQRFNALYEALKAEFRR